MSQAKTLNDALFNEAFNIISTNKSKSNSLRQSLLQNLSYNEESNSNIIGFLGELEYDLNSLYDILKDLRFSFHDLHNNLIKSDSCANECINEEKKTIGKTYSISTEKFGQNSQNNFSKINNYYINSPINKELNKSMQRSTSCKSYILNNEENNHGKPNLIKNKLIYRNNDFGLSKGKSPKLNFDYDAYFTDYTLNKTGKNSVNSYFDFLNKNIDKYEKSPEMNKRRDNNKNENIENKELNNFNDINNNSINIKNNNNIFTFSEQKNKNNQDIDDNIMNVENKNNNINKNNNLESSEPNEQDINAMNEYILDNNIPRTYEYHKKTKEEEELEELENQKKEIIKTIISEIFQDTNKLNLLKKKLGEDIGEKLLSGNINEKELYKVVKILKKEQENRLKRKNIFQKKKFNQPSDKILLKEKLNNKRYNFREFPRGWSSTKDYFINNGTTLIKDKRYKK